ncbi:MAG: rod shape-determining protein MreD [Clostridiales bacterium]|nr:rod shape-determining protein MreD [Clostridiales bacterium]
MKYPIYFLITLINFILQTTVFESVSIIGIKPNTAIIIVVSVAFIQGELDGIITGIFAGFFQDSFFSLYLGCHIFIYASVGLICGYCFKAFFKESFLLPIALTAAADLYSCLVFYILNILLRGYFNILTFLSSVVLPEIVYTVLISGLVYRLIYYIADALNRSSQDKRRLF